MALRTTAATPDTSRRPLRRILTGASTSPGTGTGTCDAAYERLSEGGRGMSADRYIKIILTIIALELGWLALKDTAVPVSAQQQQQQRDVATPVVIRGVEL